MGTRTFDWDEKYETGLAEVDAQHRSLVDLINRLGESRAAGAGDADVTAALDVLGDYAVYHFSTEEELMESAGVSREHYEAHCHTHQLFLTQIGRLVEDARGNPKVVVEQILRFLVRWLALHILGQDMEMAVEIKALARGDTPKAAHSQALQQSKHSTEVLLDALEALYDDLDASYAKLTAAYAALQQSSEAQLKDAQRLAHVGSWELDLATNRLIWSDEIYRIFEIDPAGFDISYEAFIHAVHPEDREAVDRAYRDSVALGTPYEIVHRLVMADGRIKYVQERGETSYDPDGKPLRSIGTVQDLTQRLLAEEALRESEERFRTVADYTYDWEYWRGANNELLYNSPSCKRITGYSVAEFIADPDLLLRIVHPEDRPRIEQHLNEEFHNEAVSLDFRILRRDGRLCWVSHCCQPVFAQPDGRFLGRRASNRDITDRKALEQEFQRQAQSDYLTGLANRRHFMERAEQELARTMRYRRPLSLLILDIDHFKVINDTHGHHAGDLALQQVAALCREALRTIDIISRFGGEEFAIILPETGGKNAREVAERLRLSIAGKRIAVTQKTEARLEVSIGVTTLLGGGEASLDTLLGQADEALYRAKDLGRNRVCVFGNTTPSPAPLTDTTDLKDAKFEKNTT